MELLVLGPLLGLEPKADTGREATPKNEMGSREFLVDIISVGSFVHQEILTCPKARGKKGPPFLVGSKGNPSPQKEKRAPLGNRELAGSSSTLLCPPNHRQGVPD